MWEIIVTKILDPIIADLSTTGMLIFALLLWTKFEQWTQRKRMGVVLDAKDAYNEKLTDKTLAMSGTVSDLTGVLEEIVRRLRKQDDPFR